MPVYFAHATSFCGAVWRPVIDSLEGVDSVTWDFAGHGAGRDLQPPFDWSVFGDQVLEETEPGGIGVGHSMGAAALVMAEIASPGRFRFLVLIEPIIYPGPHFHGDNEMSAVALKRKRQFTSREAALENFRSRPAFSRWHPAALSGYVEEGLSDNAYGVGLACSPEVEAEIYRGSRAHRTWERLGEVSAPVLVMVGADSDTIDPGLAGEMTTSIPRAGLEIVADTGHFLPMERPDLVAKRAGRVAALG